MGVKLFNNQKGLENFHNVHKDTMDYADTIAVIRPKASLDLQISWLGFVIRTFR